MQMKCICGRRTDGMEAWMRLMGTVVPSVLLCVAALTPVASAQKKEWGISFGYSHLSLDDASGELGEQGGFRVEPRFSWQPFGDRPELRFGIGLGLSYYYDT